MKGKVYWGLLGTGKGENGKLKNAFKIHSYWEMGKKEN